MYGIYRYPYNTCWEACLATLSSREKHHRLKNLPQKGLGLALAREFGRMGCRLVLAARDAQELVRARQDLTQCGAEVLTIPCDVTDQ